MAYFFYKGWVGEELEMDVALGRDLRQRSPRAPQSSPTALQSSPELPQSSPRAPQSFHTVALNVLDTGIMVGVSPELPYRCAECLRHRNYGGCFWRAHHTVARSEIWTLFLFVFARAHHTVAK